MADPALDFSTIISMMESLYELEKEDLDGEYCTAEMMLRQGNKLIGGLDELKSALLSGQASDENLNKVLVDNKVFDLNRVIDLFAKLIKVDEGDIRELEFEKFAAAKKETKMVLDSLKELNESGWYNATIPKTRGVTFDIGCDLDVVMSMLEALGSSDLDNADNDVILSAKEMKSRAASMLKGLPNLLSKLDDFLHTAEADSNATTAEAVRSVEDHVVVLKRVFGVLEAVKRSSDDEVDFAVYQLYGAFQDIEREARSVLESIYTMQFGESAPSSHQASPKSRHKESKGSGSKDNRDDEDDDADYPSAKDGDSDYKETSRMAQSNLVIHHVPTQLGSFDLSMVMSMLIDLGEDEEDGSNAMEDEINKIIHQSSALASGLQQVYGELTRSASAVMREQLEHDFDPDAKGGLIKSDSDMELDDTLCDMKRVLDLLEQLINCDDLDEAQELMSLKSNSSFTSVKNEVKGLLNKVASLGNLPKVNSNRNNNNNMTAADSKYDDNNKPRNGSGKQGK